MRIIISTRKIRFCVLQNLIVIVKMPCVQCQSDCVLFQTVHLCYVTQFMMTYMEFIWHTGTVFLLHTAVKWTLLCDQNCRNTRGKRTCVYYRRIELKLSWKYDVYRVKNEDIYPTRNLRLRSAQVLLFKVTLLMKPCFGQYSQFAEIQWHIKGQYDTTG